MFLSRGDRDLGVAFQTHPGRQAFISSGRLDLPGPTQEDSWVGLGQAGNSDRGGEREGRHSFLGQYLPSVHQLRPSRLLPDSPHGEGAPRRQTPNRSADGGRVVEVGEGAYLALWGRNKCEEEQGYL